MGAPHYMACAGEATLRQRVGRPDDRLYLGRRRGYLEAALHRWVQFHGRGVLFELDHREVGQT